MNPKLDAIYVALDEGTRTFAGAIGPGGLAQVDRDAALARDKLAEYGVDLTDDTTRDAIVVVLDIIIAPLSNGRAAELLRRVSSMQQACQRANAATAQAGGGT